MRVLLVTKHFPPVGGYGVQRRLKLAQHMPDDVEGIARALLDPAEHHRHHKIVLPIDLLEDLRDRFSRCAQEPAELPRGLAG